MEAILLRNLPEGVGEVYVWKKYSLQENVSYTWNRWSVVITTTYKWNKWSTENGDPYLQSSNSSEIKYVNSPSNGWMGNANQIASPVAKEIDGTLYIGGNKSSGAYIGSNTTLPIEFPYYPNVFYYSSYDYGNDNYRYTKNPVYRLKTIVSLSSSGWGVQCDLKYTAGYSLKKGSTSYGQVTSTNSSAYPSNGASGSYWYVSAGSDTTYSKGSTSYPDVSSTSDAAYPNPGHQDGYWYDNRQEVITHSMGTYIEDVFSTNPKRYPENGIDGSYWYVLQS